MFQTCQSHRNPIERICLNPLCTSRAMCLLCQHPHGDQFTSIMIKKSQSYRVFQQKLNQEIDRYFFQMRQTDEELLKKQQLKEMKKYYNEIKQGLMLFLEQTYEEAINKLKSTEQESFQHIKSARITQNYINIPNQIFPILLQVYEGQTFTNIFKANQSNKIQETYAFMSSFHAKLNALMEPYNFKLKAKLPDIRAMALNKNPQNVDQPLIGSTYEGNIEEDYKKIKYTAQLSKQTQTNAQSIVSDCIQSKVGLLVTSYDKKLRIFNSQCKLRFQQEYDNVLTKIHALNDEIYLIAKSKTIVVQKIVKLEEKETDLDTSKGFNCIPILTLPPQSSRICDLHSLNSRIIGSCSADGAKVWDLYKERCQYTWKEDTGVQSNTTCLRFLREAKNVAVGYDSHKIKVYSVQTLKMNRKYDLSGVPLMIDQGKFNQHTFFVGGFPSTLSIIDTRLHKLSFQQQLKDTSAVTCLSQSLHNPSWLYLGTRTNTAHLYDLRMRKVLLSWQAYTSKRKSNWSKPNGIVSLWQSDENELSTINCSQSKIKQWNIKQN